jgi:metal-responsive CopG/Arc/MetJ family transcriptional regulator
MKTAVSVPDDTFRRADVAAHRLGVSRSELYVRALEAYLDPPTDDEITARLDAVYTVQPGALNPAVAAAQPAAIGDTW